MLTPGEFAKEFHTELAGTWAQNQLNKKTKQKDGESNSYYSFDIPDLMIEPNFLTTNLEGLFAVCAGHCTVNQILTLFHEFRSKPEWKNLSILSAEFVLGRERYNSVTNIWSILAHSSVGKIATKKDACTLLISACYTIFTG